MTKKEFSGKRVTVWPEYLDSTKTRGQGRKIPINDAIKKPSLSEVIKACEELGLEPEQFDGRYPRNWMYSQGGVMILKKSSKRELLRMIARKISEMRDRSP